MALSEWKLTPNWINENWSEELLVTMFIARDKRLSKMMDQDKSKDKKISNAEFFRRHPQIKVVNHG